MLGHPSNESHVSRSTGTWLSCPSICKERSRVCFCRTNTQYITVLNTYTVTESVHTTHDKGLDFIITRDLLILLEYWDFFQSISSQQAK